MTGQYYDVQNQFQFDQMIKHLNEQWKANKHLWVKCEPPRNYRSSKQQAAIQIYCRRLADKLNEHGETVVPVIRQMREDADILWTEDRVKEMLWRPIQEALTGEKSSTKINRKDVTDIYDHLNRFTGGELGVFVPFPSQELPND